VIQPKVKVEVTLVQGEIFNVTIGTAAWEACSTTWDFCGTPLKTKVDQPIFVI
jgi:hypothetical protein